MFLLFNFRFLLSHSCVCGLLGVPHCLLGQWVLFLAQDSGSWELLLKRCPNMLNQRTLQGKIHAAYSV